MSGARYESCDVLLHKNLMYYVLSCCQGLPGPPGPPGEGGKPGDQVSLLFLLNIVNKQEPGTMFSGSVLHHCQ